ncbi:BspA family leucine-rich repeat surface protein [Winogradskyella sp. SYSU M77433]|uniref:BspA family leucine-rich repeat surface protein n=1 Tax=Winogradskyella sp. SYSU M77433 TaxID=3042722 RepID=UPI002480671F|nr:BspA family leucine-rich repeat surface protein [Winogradskyella sp. SYSU M77433]MDH7912091.1 BspA family leucine-rich repeat surface protein [Winogradskyella sp. SYSU M77433]
MKKKIFFILLLSTTIINAQEPFIINWEATTDNSQFEINVFNIYPDFNFTIDFGDGTVLNNQTQSVQHSYSQTGVYSISISGIFPVLDLGYFTRTNVVSVEQWGDIVWNSAVGMFSGCTNLVINATDTPDLSQVTDASSMFLECTNFNQSINNWDVSNINIMAQMFKGCTSFNQPLDNWDVSNVTHMGGMFANTSYFNQSLNDWDVSNVTSIEEMFHNAVSFNGSVDNWNTSNLIEVVEAFKGATSFNQPINSWDVSNVTDMREMFHHASNFNQPLDNWDVSNVVNMATMFGSASSFDQSLNNWDVSNVTSLWSMFFSASSFNQPLDNWDTSNVETMYEMFENATSFDQDLSDWDFSNVSIGYGFGDFLSNSNLSIYNYDKLLLSLASSAANNVSIGVGGLEYCNFNAHNYLNFNKGWTFGGDIGSSNCNNVVGSVYYDQNNDGCNDSDIYATNLMVKAEDTNMFYVSGIVTNGNYEIPVHTGNQTVFISNLPSYFTSTPQSETVDFLTTSTEQVDFCLTASQIVEDLNVTILPIDAARPGFESNYKLVIKNVGTEIINGVLTTFTFDDSKQSFISAIPAETNTSSNSLDFSIGTIDPFQSIEVYITMQNFAPPTLNADDLLNFSALVIPNSNDFTPNDNIFDLEQIVVNAYDPNDKRVLQGETITFDEKDDYLDYIIRFQNTGNANATFVRIEDELDPELNWGTLKIVSASHNYQVKITNGNEVEFLFNDINLPYEAADEINSNGYIAYKIKPKASIQVGEIMSGDASIYFDYNLPIITNLVSTEVVESLSTEEYSLENTVKLYPNPTYDFFKIDQSPNIIIESVRLYNFSGKLLREFTKSEEYSISNLSSGLYFVKIKTDKSEKIKKLIKI